MDFAEEIRDFLIESNENLAVLDQEIVELEKNPTDEKLIASVFRTIHTVKGTSGFFGFKILGSIAHVAENILGQVREKQRPLTPELVSLVLQTMDAIRAVLGEIEAHGGEGEDVYQDLKKLLEDTYNYRSPGSENQAGPNPSAETSDASEAPQTPEAAMALMAADSSAEADVPANGQANGEAAADKTDEPGEASEPATPFQEAVIQQAPMQEIIELEPQFLPGSAVEVPSEPAEVLPAVAAGPAVAQAPVVSPEKLAPARPDAPESQAAAQSPAAAKSQESRDGGARRGEDSAAANSTIRVDVSLLDKLMNLVGELVLARNQILQGAAKSGSTGTAQRLNLITSELQEGVMRTRMQPIGMVWNKLPRVVRDLAASLGKRIEIQMEGAETELDKTIIEAIKDPLMHIVRNSCDHGVESPEERLAKGKTAHGTILLRAFHEGGHVNIEIADDGAGIDPVKVKNKAVEKGLIRAEQAAAMNEWEALRLIFLPGFSTAAKITSISGRGVGMDVVKTNIEKISGSVDLSNRPTAGSSIKIKIPLTLAIIPGLIVSVKGASQTTGEREDQAEDAGAESQHYRFVIPQANLLELVRLEGDKDRRQLEKINGAAVYRRRGKLLPLAYLGDVLGLPSEQNSIHAEDRDAGSGLNQPDLDQPGVMNIVVVQAEDTAFGLVVDEVNDTQEIVVKALGKQLKALSCYVGATIMGDGKIALILDVTGIAKLAHMLSQPVERRSEVRSTGENTGAHQMLLLFRSGRFPRLVLPLSLVARLEEFPASKIEYAANAPVLRYREAILPLIWLSSLLDPGSPIPDIHQAPLQVIVFSEGGSYVGVVVDEILDIVDDAVAIHRPSTAFGLLGSGVVGGKVTDFVDLEAVLGSTKSHAPGTLGIAPAVPRRLLVVDRSKMTRGVLRGYLEMQGHTVLEAHDAEEAVAIIEQAGVDLVVETLNPQAGSHPQPVALALVGLRGSAPLPVPLLGLVDDGDDAGSLGFLQGYDQLIPRRDRAAILHAVDTLTAAVEREHAVDAPPHAPQDALVEEFAH